MDFVLSGLTHGNNGLNFFGAVIILWEQKLLQFSCFDR